MQLIRPPPATGATGAEAPTPGLIVRRRMIVGETFPNGGALDNAGNAPDHELGWDGVDVRRLLPEVHRQRDRLPAGLDRVGRGDTVMS
eukprot:SAG22_NODE_1844_length_3454_cov_2.054844_5_plen_88_part_00